MQWLKVSQDHQPLKSVPKRILVIVMRYLGDVLLVTPLLRSLRRAYPTAQLDVLLYDNTAAILAGNPDIDNLITTTLRIGFKDYMALLKRLFRRYDVALITQTGDRPFIYGLVATGFRVAVVPPKDKTGWWKRFLLQRYTEFDNEHTHTVLQNLKLLDLLGVARHHDVVPPTTNDNVFDRFDFATDKYVVLHPFPQWRYKQWTLAGWVGIGRYLRQLGFKLILSGGNLSEEQAYLATLAHELPKDTVNLAGHVSLAELSLIIARAKLYIGPDTGITHLAAATAVPVIALYGPTNPVKWAPWPSGFAQDYNPFERIGSQKVNNVHLVQGQGDCVPCHLEGCDRHRQSYSHCLDTLSIQQIKFIIDQTLCTELSSD